MKIPQLSKFQKYSLIVCLVAVIVFCMSKQDNIEQNIENYTNKQIKKWKPKKGKTKSSEKKGNPRQKIDCGKEKGLLQQFKLHEKDNKQHYTYKCLAKSNEEKLAKDPKKNTDKVKATGKSVDLIKKQINCHDPKNPNKGIVGFEYHENDGQGWYSYQCGEIIPMNKEELAKKDNHKQTKPQPHLHGQNVDCGSGKFMKSFGLAGDDKNMNYQYRCDGGKQEEDKEEKKPKGPKPGQKPKPKGPKGPLDMEKSKKKGKKGKKGKKDSKKKGKKGPKPKPKGPKGPLDMEKSEKKGKKDSKKKSKKEKRKEKKSIKKSKRKEKKSKKKSKRKEKRKEKKEKKSIKKSKRKEKKSKKKSKRKSKRKEKKEKKSKKKSKRKSKRKEKKSKRKSKRKKRKSKRKSKK